MDTECSVVDHVVVRDGGEQVGWCENEIASGFGPRVGRDAGCNVDLLTPYVCMVSNVDPVVLVDDLMHCGNLINVGVKIPCNDGGGELLCRWSS